MTILVQNHRCLNIRYNINEIALNTTKVEFFTSAVRKTQWKKVVHVKNILFQKHHLRQKSSKEWQGLLIQNSFCRLVYRFLTTVPNVLYAKLILHGNEFAFAFQYWCRPHLLQTKSVLSFLHVLIHTYITKDKVFKDVCNTNVCDEKKTPNETLSMCYKEAPWNKIE